MTQSFFRGRTRGKPQDPIPLGKPMPTSRDATDNIKRAGTPGSDDRTKASADSLRHAGVIQTKLAADKQEKHEREKDYDADDFPFQHMPFGPEWLARYGKGQMADAAELDRRTAQGDKTKGDLGLRRKK